MVFLEIKDLLLNMFRSFSYQQKKKEYVCFDQTNVKVLIRTTFVAIVTNGFVLITTCTILTTGTFGSVKATSANTTPMQTNRFVVQRVLE